MIDLDEIDVIIITTYQVNCCEKKSEKWLLEMFIKQNSYRMKYLL